MKADWYLMRASGFVALALLTVTLSLGIANLGKLARARRTRTVAALVHRNVSLLAVVFVAIHIITAVTDKYSGVPIAAVLVPGASHYDALWVGLGALSLDAMMAVSITSLLRAKVPERAWRLVHWLSYACWPTAFVHSIGSGSGTGADTGAAWSTLVYLACGTLFLAAVATRIGLARRPRHHVPAPRYPAVTA